MHSPNTCAECGAPLVDGMNCWEQLGGIISWEWQDPDLLAEHFLTVASYNLQHPARFRDVVIAGLTAAFIERLDSGIAVEEIRRRIAGAYEGSTRVLKGMSERRTSLRSWDLTVADVYLPDRPEGAAARVRAWAASIRRQL